jgi:hypothetical protein
MSLIQDISCFTIVIQVKAVMFMTLNNLTVALHLTFINMDPGVLGSIPGHYKKK